jgi:rare lipoprotein A
VLKRKLGAPVAPAPVAQATLDKPQTPPAKVAPKPTPKPAPKPAPAFTAKGLFVQVGAYSSQERADSIAKSLGASAEQAGKVWRVRTGPHKDRGQADAALAKARAAGYADARVVTAP